MTAALACAPECGWTLAYSAPKRSFTRSIGELLDDVDVLAAAVVAPARVALGVLVGEHRALGGRARPSGAKFSLAIISRVRCWRAISRPIAAWTSGSASASDRARTSAPGEPCRVGDGQRHRRAPHYYDD